MNIEDMKCCGNCRHNFSAYEYGKGVTNNCLESKTKTSDSCCIYWKFDDLKYIDRIEDTE